MASVVYNYASYTPTTVTVIDARTGADTSPGGKLVSATRHAASSGSDDVLDLDCKTFRRSVARTLARTNINTSFSETQNAAKTVIFSNHRHV